ncbi:hypothetical protein [Oceaniovalibus sp. ACAM 378]|uniref:hypothetical protein n=1 Tax=Oceaniovalibus sp. ACAM 378 TaxID=2599923 RepID=UPI0011D680FF|nr:hypothetical protein [Oceaniovalibus sp. ACAM 378]TYB84870.1 hypothetical protein FQ320_20430 [Oceaniovalibus sp. ACAM 378]
MTPEDIAALFTRSTGEFAFARWGRPIAPVAFGVDDTTLVTLKDALQAVSALSGQDLAELDPELGVNQMWFFLRDWSELAEVRDLDRMIPDLAPLIERLQEAGANQYRIFRFDENGAIRAAFVFLRMDGELSALPAEVLCLSQAVQTILLWSDRAFADRSPLALAGGVTILRPEVGALIRAAHDPVLPAYSNDPTHALRLYARMNRAQ